MSEILERAARAVATANGYHYSGDSILDNAADNPRSAHFVAVADAVLKSIDDSGNFFNWLSSSKKVLSAINGWRTQVPDDVYEAADELQQSMPTNDFQTHFKS